MIDWIAEESLKEAADQLFLEASNTRKKAEKRRKKNVVDPFSTILIASTFEIQQLDSLMNMQQTESSIRGMSNALGKFHQSILSSVDGWANHDSGYDLTCESLNIIAEIKNKWNTMNNSNREQVKEELRIAIRQKKGRWEAYLVQIIPKKPRRFKNELDKDFYEVDGASFYHIVTGNPNALHDLFDYLCNDLCKRVDPSEKIVAYCKDIMSSSIPPRKKVCE
ncbi:MAG: Eco47II family restriction endonuclease [Proteobacteria bacterium]|nr:Eco47II family restriction endonuclease [Pseudomonadota bacterium]